MEIILTNGNIVDVASKTIYKGDIVIKNGIITGIEPGNYRESKNKINLAGRYVAPGFIDFHLHVESSMLSPWGFSMEALKHGTTAIFVDPHEIANVSGRLGIELFLRQAELVPLDMYVGIPSCVPATDLESSGGSITLQDIKELISDKRIYGLAEMMNFPGIIHGFGDAREKVDFVFQTGKIIDGHCPGVMGDDLEKYVTNGKNDGVIRIMSDHETATYKEAIAKSGRGMFVGLRFGSASKDMERILPPLIKNKVNLDKFMLCSDDLDPLELYKQGHMDRIIKKARDIIMENSDSNLEKATITAISLATLNPGRYYSKLLNLLDSPGIGEIREGNKANLAIFNSIENLDIHQVIYNGELVIEKNSYFGKPLEYDYSEYYGRVNVGKRLFLKDFEIKAPVNQSTVKAKIIEVIPKSIITKETSLYLPVKNQQLRADTNLDLAKIAVFERHQATGNHSLGFVRGLGIKKGAIASTIAHDSHNLIITGVDEGAMVKAGNFLIEKGGGMVVVVGEDIEYFPLKIGGLMSDSNIETVVQQYGGVIEAVKNIGTSLENIFMTMSFLALPVIPKLKITDKGLVDVEKFAFVKLWEKR